MPRVGCVSTTLTDAQARAAGLVPRAGGVWVRTTCTHFSGPRTTTYTFRRQGTPGAPGRPAAPPRALIERARDSIVLPAPTIRMSPRVEWEQIVQLPSWLWIEREGFRRRQAQASAGGITVTATATPRRVVWDMGDGGRTTCTSAGAAYDERRPAERQRTDCSYTYRRSSDGEPGERYTVTATVEYDVTWTAQGVPGGGSLGTVRRAGSVGVRVAELQAVS